MLNKGKEKRKGYGTLPLKKSLNPYGLASANYPAGLEAVCAYPDALGAAVHDSLHGLQVGKPPTLRVDVRMADIVPVDRALIADITDFRHMITSFARPDIPN